MLFYFLFYLIKCYLIIQFHFFLLVGIICVSFYYIYIFIFPLDFSSGSFAHVTQLRHAVVMLIIMLINSCKPPSGVLTDAASDQAFKLWTQFAQNQWLFDVELGGSLMYKVRNGRFVFNQHDKFGIPQASHIFAGFLSATVEDIRHRSSMECGKFGHGSIVRSKWKLKLSYKGQWRS